MEKNINKLTAGTNQEISLLVQRIERATAKNGSAYQKLYVRDTCDNETVIYNFDNLVNLNTPVVVNAKLDTSMYNEGNMRSKLISFTIDPKTPSSMFMPKSKINLHEHWNELVSMTKGLGDVYRKIITKTLMKDQKKFVYYPMSQSKSFARLNGILEATVALMKLADTTAKITHVDYDLVMTAAAVYYVGCVDTMNDSFCGTEDEYLLGLSISSYNRVMAAVREIEEENKASEELTVQLDPEKIKLLSHIILSRYKGLNTVIPEAVILRHLDTIVTETDIMNEQVKDSTPGSFCGYGSNKVYKRN